MLTEMKDLTCSSGLDLDIVLLGDCELLLPVTLQSSLCASDIGVLQNA